ncbi:MAG: type II secretion system F family protein [Verrucomicrobiota bacterium]|nr:type II secretion system F family protein [Verrucomicrobiota bacterium]
MPANFATPRSSTPVNHPRILRQRDTMTLFIRQLATLLEAGVPLVRALDTLTLQQKRQGFRTVLSRLANTVRAGGSFSDGVAEFPRLFDRLSVNMIRAGEAGGVLEKVLTRMAVFREKSDRMRKRVQAALIYPVVVITVALIIVLLLMCFVVPKFQAIYQSLPQLKSVPLPVLTRLIIGVGHTVQTHFIAAIGLLGMAFFAIALLGRSERAANAWDKIVLRIPLFGELIAKVSIARFSRTLGILIASGVPLLDAIRITRNCVGNRVLAQALDTVHDRVRDGDTLTTPLEHTAVFPPMVLSMVQIGEETGRLPSMLERIADAYEEDVDRAVGVLTSIIEPLMIVLLAILVGTIVIALFLPIIGIIENLGR